MGERRGRDVTVLHVDDDPAFVDLVARFLEDEDDRIAVETATNTVEGLAAVDEGGVDCVVSDYDMPGHNGIEFLEAVRADHPDLPFILFTGKGGEEVASDAISAGVTDYLQKTPGTDQYAILANRIRNAVERTRAERERRESERRFEAVFNDPKMIISILDPDGRLRKTNETAMKLVDVDREAAYGELFWETVWWEESRRPEVRDWVERARTGEYVDYEIEHPTREGEWKRVNGTVRPVTNEAGEITSLLVAGRDVTGHRKHERELELLRDRMEFALEVTNAHIWTTEFETGESEIYGPVEPLYHASAEEVKRPDYYLDNLVHPDDRERLGEMFDAVGAGESEEVTIEFRSHPDRGELRWLRSEGVVREERDKRRLVGLTMDVTEQQERERTLEIQNERLEEFASVVSHDLRNPLNVAEGQVELARQDCDSDHLVAVQEACERMGRLIEDLLVIARDGQAGTDPEPVALADLLDRCWANSPTDDATLSADVTGTIRADRGRLQQLFENLIRNAVEHGGDGVTVRVGDTAEGFYVADDGPGIPPAERERVFEMGYSDDAGGTGFGLSIVEQVAEAHGWTVSVGESDAGGARFDVGGVERLDADQPAD